MGYRLQGVPIEQARREQLLSSAVTFGTVQLLPNGQLIVLMADHQTTGGYPRVGTVIRADLPLLAQMNPGDGFQFSITTMDAAEAKWKMQQEALAQLQQTCQMKINSWSDANRY
jgi:antagonist of KipI